MSITLTAAAVKKALQGLSQDASSHWILKGSDGTKYMNIGPIIEYLVLNVDK